MSLKSTVLVLSCSLMLGGAFVACGGGSGAKSPEGAGSDSAGSSSTGGADSASPPDSASAAKTDPPPAKKKSAKEVLEAGGTFGFSLADSADAKKLAGAKCEKIKDAKKKEACDAEVDKTASGEGLRFEKGDKLVYVSYVTEKDKEVILVKVPVKLEGSDEKVTMKADGKAEGKMGAKISKKDLEAWSMTIELADETTIKTTDPKKGTLVFKKK